jgi:hypothetical protein
MVPPGLPCGAAAALAWGAALAGAALAGAALAGAALAGAALAAVLGRGAALAEAAALAWGTELGAVAGGALAAGAVVGAGGAVAVEVAPQAASVLNIPRMTARRVKRNGDCPAGGVLMYPPWVDAAPMKVDQGATRSATVHDLAARQSGTGQHRHRMCARRSPWHRVNNDLG